MYIPRFKNKPFPFAPLLKRNNSGNIQQKLSHIQQNTKKVNQLLPPNIQVLQVLVMQEKVTILVQSPMLVMYLKRMQNQILAVLELQKNTVVHIELLKINN
jgi:hypothetical protein